MPRTRFTQYELVTYDQGKSWELWFGINLLEEGFGQSLPQIKDIISEYIENYQIVPSKLQYNRSSTKRYSVTEVIE